MHKQEITFDDNAVVTLALINNTLSRKLKPDELINSIIAFNGMIFAMANEDELFRENLNNIMRTKDFRRFFTGEAG